MKLEKTKPLYLLIDSRGGTKCAELCTNDMGKADENWERFILLSSESKKEICHHANVGDYGANCVVANEHGLIFWEWYSDKGKWNCNEKSI
jgi:hypothetical protein